MCKSMSNLLNWGVRWETGWACCLAGVLLGVFKIWGDFFFWRSFWASFYSIILGIKFLFGRAFHQYLIMARFFSFSSWEKILEAFSFLLKNVFLVGVSSDVFTNVWPNLLPWKLIKTSDKWFPINWYLAIKYKNFQINGLVWDSQFLKKIQKAAARESVAPFSLASQLLKRFPRVVRARFDMRVNRETINRS